jgi:hypothetical protein
MNRAAIVAGATIAVEKAVLVNSIDIVAWDASAKAILVVIKGAGAFNVRTVDFTISIIVNAI